MKLMSGPGVSHEGSREEDPVVIFPGVGVPAGGTGTPKPATPAERAAGAAPAG